MRRSSASEYQMRYMRCILDGVLLRQKTAKASTTDNYLFFRPREVYAYTLNIVDDLLESVWFGPGTLPMTSEIEGEDTKLIAEIAVNVEIGFMITYSIISWYSRCFITM